MSSSQWDYCSSSFQDANSAHNVSGSYSDSMNVDHSKLVMRETGIIEKLLHTYGFIQCCDRQARLFFHYSQFTGNIEHLKIGDPVEFEMTYDRKTGKPIASEVVKISSSVISYEVLGEERVFGTVTTEVKDNQGESGGSSFGQGRISYESRGECFFLPYTLEDVECDCQLNVGDRVGFQIATDKRTGNLRARHIQSDQPPTAMQRLQGIISSMKDTFGFIERADVVKEIFFHVSEVDNFEELKAGDGVEFGVQSRNGKEVAVNVVCLPDGSVVFEDVDETEVIGVVVNVVDRGSSRLQSNLLSGKIRHALDGVEEELSFGDKDVISSFTLLTNDQVRFNVATDRRDQLRRATNVEIVEESFASSKEKRETGVVVSVKDGFGFIKCQDRDARLFFHFSEVVDQSRIVHLHDEVEFSVVQDGANDSRQNAIRLRCLPKGTIHCNQMNNRSTLTGIVEKEAANQICLSPSKDGEEEEQQQDSGGGSTTNDFGKIVYGNEDNFTVFYSIADCDSHNLPKIGDKVQFNLCDNKCNGGNFALDVRVVGRSIKNGFNCCHKGYVAALKETFGFIENDEHNNEVFFHFSVFDGDASKLELGTQVDYSVSQKSNKVSAELVRVSKENLVIDELSDEVLRGVVARPIRCFNPDQSDYPGLITFASEDESVEYEFGITSLQDKREFLQKGDSVQFQAIVGDNSGRLRAGNVVALRDKLQATVEAIKGQFGFLSHENESGKKLFFHMSEVKDGAILQQGDKVEFVVIHNQRSGRYSACCVSKISSAEPRPEHMVARFRAQSLTDETGPRVVVVRQPRGPDGTTGFSCLRENKLDCETQAKVE